MYAPLELPHHLFLVSDLCNLLETYLEATQVKEVYRAYLFSAEAHDGQKRKSGEPYISHPLAATYILGQMHMDTQTLCAALLHDVIEDTGITKDKLESEFGEQVAELVDGVSKLSSVHFETREQAQAASFRKMLLAMNRDIRVIIVKLADRLHNLRTLGAMKHASRRRIARETLDIYAPIAHRLGMNAMRIELEELSFAALYPRRYQVLVQRMQKVSKKRTAISKDIQQTIEKCLVKRSIQAQVQLRDRHAYSIYYKMRDKKKATSVDKRKTFSQVTNVCALRIIVDSIDACYLALGAVHSLYKPKCDRFNDYIAIPKINGYQSLHTVLFSHYRLLIEIQIRTTDMHELSESGITAYGLDHFDKSANHEQEPHPSCQRANEWLRELLKMQKSSDSLEFLEHVKTDLFPEEVYVFTPHGKIMQLPKGATPIDFAYAIHSDVGNQCIAVKIDNQYASLSTSLVSGQTVEVLTAAWARPNPNWLNFAVSARARSYIRHFSKNLQYDEAVLLGKRMLNKELATYALSVDKLDNEQRTQLIKSFQVDSLETLLHDIGLGNRMALIIARQFDPKTDITIKTVTTANDKPKPLIIKGTEGLLVNFARCCRPIPGDEIVGLINTGRGIIIHTATCKYVTKYRHSVEKLQAVEWEYGIEGEFLVEIRVEVRDKRGVLAHITTAIANMGCNIEEVSNENSEGGHSTLKFCISVRNREQLAAIMRHLRRLEDVIRIQRSKANYQ
ncbi:MAG: guanosine-3',5'-bis(diphosphate) 3'-diphosphatase [Candidatus Parabeggiatoa sp. nov. 3]|nr:MAG: guanosine-3',5'-bis(diphosphate) 3'-diphosphatase [Gammaproteobacteria bacterium]RKZ64641.1 MAG: guanosine-3',5'-bis(diphosphate) 3'-diphosphatase [Gammaproteobacteria bacterium]RKZ84129.1 MAG: guanosine-3',5'-bis(diphosphate) 3'-diphosphatase [Gammaproteobacteria bacterium]